MGTMGCGEMANHKTSNFVAGGRSVSKVNDEWFADEERVRASVGLLEKPTPARKPGVKEVKCPFFLLSLHQDEVYR